MSLQGAKCLIAGGSRGIGKAIALRFARQGATCNIVGRNADTLRSLVSELRSVRSTRAMGDPPDKALHGYTVGDVSRLEFWKSWDDSYRVELTRIFLLEA